MAQLSDDCFAFGGALQSLDAARALIARSVACAVGTETVPLLEADGRVLAADLHAEFDLPPFANSAVDGYAVRLADISGEVRVSARLAAGAQAQSLQPGTAQRIFTGAMLPPGADTVFMQEDVELVGDRVRLPAGLKPGANTRPAGEDLARGALALARGTRLLPQHVALAAALGAATLEVRRRLRVALFSTGDELVDPPARPGPAQRFDSNRVLLAALCRRAGAEITDLGILPDRRHAIAAALLQAAEDHHAILTTGGVSAGEEDHVRDALAQVGRLGWWRLAIKPGRPVAMGDVGGAPFMGNPVAAFVTFVQVARPMLAALAGETDHPPEPLPVPAAFAYRKKAGRREYVRVRIVEGQAHRHPIEGAGILTSLTKTDGLAQLDDAITAIRPGDPIGFLPFASLL